jgi:hypothetical protein
LWKEWDYTQWNVQSKFSYDLKSLTTFLTDAHTHTHIYIYIYTQNTHTYTHNKFRKSWADIYLTYQYLCIFFIFRTYNMKKISYVFLFKARLSVCNINDIILKYMHSCYSFILRYLLFLWIAEHKYLSLLQAPKFCLYLL